LPTYATIATAINGFVMDVPHSKFVRYEHIQIYPKNNPVTSNQKWAIVISGDDVGLPPSESGNPLCIDIPHSTTKSGTLVQLFPLDKPGGAPNQQWKYIPAGDNLNYIASALGNDLVLDVIHGEGAAGTKIQIFKRGDRKPNQLWYVDPA